MIMGPNVGNPQQCQTGVTRPLGRGPVNGQLTRRPNDPSRHAMANGKTALTALLTKVIQQDRPGPGPGSQARSKERAMPRGKGDREPEPEPSEMSYTQANPSFRMGLLSLLPYSSWWVQTVCRLIPRLAPSATAKPAQQGMCLPQ